MTYNVSREIELVKAAKIANPALEIPADIEAAIAQDSYELETMSIADESEETARFEPITIDVPAETSAVETTVSSSLRYQEELEAQYPGLKEARLKREARRAEIISQLTAQFPGRKINNIIIHEVELMDRQECVCAECKGVPCSKEVNKGWITKIEPDRWNGLTATKYRCAYVVEAKMEAANKKLFENAKIPGRYAQKTWDDYEVTADNKNAVGWAHHVIEKKLSQWLYFQGVPGTGKTLLVSLMARDLIRQGKRVIFVDTPYLLNELRGSFNKDSEVDIDKKMDALEKTDVLILDDFGTETATEWAAERMYQIINTRYNDGRQTLITSNLTLNEIAAKFNNPRNGKPGQTGSRMASRLTEMCKIATLKGADRRLKK